MCVHVHIYICLYTYTYLYSHRRWASASSAGVTVARRFCLVSPSSSFGPLYALTREPGLLGPPSFAYVWHCIVYVEV